MTPDQQIQDERAPVPDAKGQTEAQTDSQTDDDFDGLKGKKASELTPEELRLMADTMPGEGPGD